MHLYPIDGAASRVAADATAFAYCDGGWAGIIAGVDPDPADAGLISQWAVTTGRNCKIAVQTFTFKRRPGPDVRKVHDGLTLEVSPTCSVGGHRVERDLAAAGAAIRTTPWFRPGSAGRRGRT
jgi:hypothetical protein